VPTPAATSDRLSPGGAGMDLAARRPSWEPAEPTDWQPPADSEALADWEPPADSEALADWESSADWEHAELGGDGAWFASGELADDLVPGPALAGFAADAWAAGLARLNDDELIGMLRAARRLASWAAAMELAAAGDLWRRRWDDERAGGIGAAYHADDEIAAALTLTGRAANHVLSLAVALHRLPLTSEALRTGDIDLPRAMVIADEVTGLDDEHAAAVEQAIIGVAPGQTTGQLRAATRRAVIAADPQAARRRKERALQEARVERWNEHAGTATLAGRDLPAASVLAADQNLSALARQLKAAGAPGTLDQLRAQVYLALLTGSAVCSLIPASSHLSTASSRVIPAGSNATSRNTTSDSPQDGTGSAGHSPDHTTSFGSCPPAGLATPTAPGAPTGPGAPTAPGAPTGPGTSGDLGLTGSVNLTMPLATWLGLSDAAGNAAGYGPLDADDSRAIAEALADRSDTKWCLTLTDSRGRPVAHGCTRAGPLPVHRHAQRPIGPLGKPGIGSRAGPASAPGGEIGPRGGPAGAPCAETPGTGTPGTGTPGTGTPGTGTPGTGTPGTGAPGDSQRASQPGGSGTPGPDPPRTPVPGRTWIFGITLLAGDNCDHSRETAAYRPSPALRHLIEIRHATCTYPGCRRPATRCDADHTLAYHRGGKTCLCNLAPLCRHHHEVKQSAGWTLDQASPGIMTWTTPAGRRYAVGPTSYPT